MTQVIPTVIPSSLELELYVDQVKRLPCKGRHLLAHSHTPDTLVVYQAFKPSIAVNAVKHQCFTKDNPDYNPTRMTWIKPGFLWMMYRSGWAAKQHQEHILALHINKQWFMEILANRAILSAHTPTTSSSETPAVVVKPRDYDVVVQWDPDHDWQGSKLTRRAIQVGLRGNTAAEFAQGVEGPAVVLIEDVTGFVGEMRENVVAKGGEVVEASLWVPREEVVEVEGKIHQVLQMDA